MEALVISLLNESGIRPHSVTSRVKTPSSLERKILKRPMGYESLDAIHDLSGIRITTYFADEVDRVAELIIREFEIDEQNSIDKRRTLDPDRFGYLSLHFVASIKNPRDELPEYARFAGTKIEIQIRSILQHAWAEIEHDLGYKTAHAIPDSVRRQFAKVLRRIGRTCPRAFDPTPSLFRSIWILFCITWSRQG
jgi:ppGpp synthetase/RelA/SpoT-type nucleotidyltranferase